MAFKTQIDRLPIIPANAQVHNATCHYCIVGCGYKAYTWPVNQQGTFTENWTGEDLSSQQPAETANWYAPSMYNVVRQNGRPVHLVIKPDVDCVVNSGLGSIRGARMAENRRSDVTGTQKQRLTEPLVWRYGTWQPTSWDDALDLVARVTARVIDNPLFTTLDQPGIGSYQAPGLPMSVDGAHTAAAVAPVLGEHTAAVLAGRLGMSSGEIAALIEQGVVAP